MGETLLFLVCQFLHTAHLNKCIVLHVPHLLIWIIRSSPTIVMHFNYSNKVVSRDCCDLHDEG